MPAAAIEMMIYTGIVMAVSGFGLFMIAYKRDEDETSTWEDVCAMITMCGLVNIAVGIILWIVK
jgi:NADH:ubiquinone oxidoreductase subunit 6 (subunit J)